MTTRNMELTHQWVLVAPGPVSMISFEPGRSAKNSLPQVCISTTIPDSALEGHEISSLTSAEIADGEGLYARASGVRSRLVITTDSADVYSVATMTDPVLSAESVTETHAGPAVQTTTSATTKRTKSKGG